MKSTHAILRLAMLATASVHAQQVLWVDNFDGPGTSPDPRYWTHDLGGGGWGNNELQVYTLQNAQVSNGGLHITADRIGDDFTSARLTTKDKVEVKYGKIEAAIQVPVVSGKLWPAFWTLGASFPEVPWPKCGELDIMEIGQGSAGELVNNRVISAAHWFHETDNTIASWPGQLDLPTFLYDAYYVYTLEWTPDRLETFVNGQSIWAMDISPGACPTCTELHDFHFLVLNMAVGGGFTVGNHSSCGVSSSWAGDCPAPTPGDVTASFPAVMHVDYVKITANAYTEIRLPSTSVPTAAPVPAQNTNTEIRPTSQPTSGPTAAPIPAPQESNNQVLTTLSPTFPRATEGVDNYDAEDYYNEDWRYPGNGGKGSKSSKTSKSKSDVYCPDGTRRRKLGKSKSSKSSSQLSACASIRTSSLESSDASSTTLIFMTPLILFGALLSLM